VTLECVNDTRVDVGSACIDEVSPGVGQRQETHVMMLGNKGLQRVNFLFE